MNNPQRKRFSLTAQLITVVTVMMVIVLLFFSGIFTTQVKEYVYSEALSIAHNSHQSLVKKIKNNEIDIRNLNIIDTVQHFIYVDGKIVSGSTNEKISYNVVSNIYGIASSSELETALDIYVGNENYYYCFSKVKNIIVVSILDNNIASSLENSILSSVTMYFGLFFMIILIVLLFWSLRIILDLLLMRKYVNSVKKGESSYLHISRQDEIGDLANDLVELEKELKNQEEVKEEMIHNISHDLKTPIATIRSYAESIKDGIYPYDSLEKSVDVIIDNADRLDKKVHSLLVLNRVDYIIDQTKTMKFSTNMSKVVKLTVQQMKMIRPKIKIRTSLDSDIIFLGEEESWRIVVENLLDNALRHANNEIHIILKDKELSVENDGDQIPDDMKNKLFKPYEKGNKGKFGLGLSICYKICHGYNYSISGNNSETGVIFEIKFIEPKQNKPSKFPKK